MEIIGMWLLSFFLMAIETWGSVYFFEMCIRDRVKREYMLYKGEE